MSTPITQLFAKRLNKESASAFINAKPDHVGWIVNTTKPEQLKESFLAEQATVARHLEHSGIKSLVLVHPTVDADVVRKVVNIVRPQIMLASAHRDLATLERIKSVIGAWKGDIMVPIGLPVPGTSLDGYDPLAEVRAYESIADWFTTDTINSSNETKAFGCSGNVTSVAQVCGVVNSTTRPVIVAGGMSGTNVADVWAICRPAGFDAHSAVCLEGVPNYERSKAFVDAVRALDE